MLTTADPMLDPSEQKDTMVYSMLHEVFFVTKFYITDNCIKCRHLISAKNHLLGTY